MTLSTVSFVISILAVFHASSHPTVTTDAWNGYEKPLLDDQHTENVVADSASLLEPSEILNGLKYRLDLVDCPRAKVKENSLVTYKTVVFYYFWQRKHKCCSRRVKKQSLSNKKTVSFHGGDKRGVVQHFHFQCPDNTRGDIISMTTDLLPRVNVGDRLVCLDYLSITFEGNNVCSDLCGKETIFENTNNCRAQRFFKEILVTFRSGYSSKNLMIPSFFNITIMCSQVSLANEVDCLETDAELSSEEYFHQQDEDFMNDFERKETIPNDAKSTLMQFHEHYEASFTPVKMQSKMWNLAVLSLKSCDEGLRHIAQDVISLLEGA